ncbi:hypothetical protein AB0P21_38940 [Kribbella sp. NPDC056861]|uniref:hypothetical protein n=1 Tax=Kribbella sp. NPDC056861 TaxID=3154857 RepID=UPI00342434FC
MALGNGRPALTDDVFVEPLPGTDLEREPAVREQRRGGSRLRDNRWWYRMKGQVTPVASLIRDVRAAATASIEKANPECSCSDTQGWK